jgi:hypothetical protein
VNLKPIMDTAVNVAAAVAAPVLTLLVDTHALSATVATDVGVIVAAAVTTYHGGTWTQRRAEAQRPKVVATVIKPESEATAAPGSAFVGAETAIVSPGDHADPAAATP